MSFDEFSSKCKELGERAQIPPIEEPNEAQTRAMLVVPLLRALGYDVDDLEIVVPEFQVRFGDANPEAVDYAIIGEQRRPIILVETKRLNSRLDGNDARQLSRYYNVTPASVGILTNGAIYEVYLDKDIPNVMDEKPFFTFNLSNDDDLARCVIYKLARWEDRSFDQTEFEQAVEDWRITSEDKPKAMRVFQKWYEGSANDLGKLLAQQLTMQEGRAAERLVNSLAAEWFKEFVDNIAHSRPIQHQPEPEVRPQPPAPAPEWMPLREWRINTTPDMPDEIMFPDQSMTPIHNGYDVPVEITRWLRRNRYLRDEHIPMRTGQNGRGRMFLLSFEQDDPMQAPREVSVEGERPVWIATGFNAPTQVINAQNIVRQAFQNPTDFLGRWRQ